MGNLNMKISILCGAFGLCLISASSFAASTGVAYDVATVKALASANMENGKALAAEHCAECHGDHGVNPDDEFPNIAGQVASYAFKQLMDIRDKNRKSRKMRRRIKNLTDQELMDLALYYETLAPERRAEPAPAIALVDKGDGKRMLTPCASCHGSDAGGGDFDVPMLKGQHPDHFIAAMEAFRDGSRANDIYGKMREAALELTDEEIEALANYYSGLEID